LEHLKARTVNLELLAAPGIMGGTVAKSVGLKNRIVGRVGTKTSAKDTMGIARLLKRKKVDLLAFCGGDGTARDILRAVDGRFPVLGVPAGVKVYSSVFAIGPGAAAESAIQFLERKGPTREGEVLDIDEEEYRENRLSVRLIGHLTIPDSDALLQDPKSPTHISEAAELEGIAEYFKEEFVKPNAVYVLGPGSTVAKVGERLGVKKTLLGVDAIKGDGKILGLDLDERKLLRLVGKTPVKVIVSPIGGSGFLFGRGNQQISAQVLSQIGTESVIVVAARSKLDRLVPRRLLVDTGDQTLDQALRGYRRVISGYREEIVVKVE
jgi:predicted polyphosphate/ATP-dependent NAD kinase